MKYEPVFFKGNYPDRQRKANEAGCICYAEQHFNSIGPGKRPDDDAPTDAQNRYRAAVARVLATNYAMAILAPGASAVTRAWASDYVTTCASRIGIRSGGVYIPAAGGRGNVNVKYFKGPAMLLEPLFISSKLGSELARSEIGQGIIASCLVDSICRAFPEGGKVGLSIGHAGKVPDIDPGAKAYGTPTVFEATLARSVLERAAAMLSIAE